MERKTEFTKKIKRERERRGRGEERERGERETIRSNKQEQPLVTMFHHPR